MTKSIKRIGPAEFQELREQRPDVALIDVRAAFEQIAFGKIPGVVNIPLGSLPSRLNELPTDKSHPIVMICQSGGRSLGAANMLIERGYTNVYNLDGGTGAWKRTHR